MDSTVLTATSPLDGYSHTFDDTRVSEVSSLVIVSISVPRNGKAAINQQLQALWQAEFPDTGQCTRIDASALADFSSSLVLYGLQADQCFLVCECDGNSIQAMVDKVYSLLGDVAYLTDQSDSWAVLDVQGSLTLPAMERICMLDLAAMTTSQVARTMMEHLSVIIDKAENEKVRLYSPRSSAGSFLHAVSTSLENVREDQCATS